MMPRLRHTAHSGHRSRRGLIGPLVLLMLAVTAAGCVRRRAPATRSEMTPESPHARAIVAALAAPESSGFAGEPIDVEALGRVYADRRNAPLWIDESGKTDTRAEAIAAVLADAASEGLDPRDYHADAIRHRLATPTSGDAVPLELLLSDGALRYAVHQTSGVRPPAARDPEASLTRGDPDPGTLLRELAMAPDPGANLRAFAPAHELYRRLRDALAHHRRIEAEGGWPATTDVAAPILRRRLVMSGDLDDGTNPPQPDHEALVVAVRRFQWRHGIAPDGTVGKSTIAALSVPVGRRIEEIIANMERWRWFPAELGERYVKVNIPDYSLELVQNGVAAMTMPVVVGKTDWRTPVISSEIRRIVFNPSWSVPTSIATKEILPKASVDTGYLARQGLVARRVPVAGDPEAGATSPRTVVRLRQAPGPQNPLGRVKFEMPNPFGVYLHDTPSRRGFARSSRALSHGCIRLRDPLGLADALLAGTDGWSDERRAQILSTWKTQSIALASPMPVYVQYATAWIDELGAPHFRPDVYERDQALRQQMADAGRAPLDARSRQRRATESNVALP